MSLPMTGRIRIATLPSCSVPMPGGLKLAPSEDSSVQAAAFFVFLAAATGAGVVAANFDAGTNEGSVGRGINWPK